MGREARPPSSVDFAPSPTRPLREQRALTSRNGSILQGGSVPWYDLNVSRMQSSFWHGILLDRLVLCTNSYKSVINTQYGYNVQRCQLRLNFNAMILSSGYLPHNPPVFLLSTFTLPGPVSTHRWKRGHQWAGAMAQECTGILYYGN